MLVDIGELAAGERLETEVCVVGSGPTGLALARELAGGGRATILVESGALEPDRDGDRLNRGEDDGIGLVAGRARALGGASRLWAGQCLPLDPLDFDRRDWVPDSGWPLSATELRPFLARAERFFEVEGEPYDETVWRPFGIEPPALDPELLRHLATVYTPEPDLGKRFLGELRRSTCLRVLLRATATRIVAGESRQEARELLVAGLDGREATIAARDFVLCAGAIENARLLLLSDGLGNDRDLVGRYLQDHPNCHAGEVVATEPRPLVDRYSLLYGKRVRYFPKLAAAPELQRRRRLLNGIANLILDFGDDSGLEAGKRLYRAARERRLPPAAGRDLRRER